MIRTLSCEGLYLVCGGLAVGEAIGPFKQPSSRTLFPSKGRSAKAAPPKKEFSKEKLWEAARKGDVEALKEQIDGGISVNARTRYGATALWFAIYKKHPKAVQFLLENKADVNLADTVWGQSPLALAASEERLDLVRDLLKAGAKGGDGVFLGAAARGKGKLMQAVLDKHRVSAETLGAALLVAPAKPEEIVTLLKKAAAKPFGEPASEEERKRLDAIAGTYESPNGFALRVARTKSALVVFFATSPLYVLTSKDKIEFRAVGHDSTIFSFTQKDGKFTRMALKQGPTESLFDRVAEGKKPEEAKPDPITDDPIVVKTPRNWPSFRGVQASGVADDQFPPTTWDLKKPHKNQWKTPIPGLGHSCPIVWGDIVFLTTAVSSDLKSDFKAGSYGDVGMAKDNSKHSWRVYCLDKKTGKVLWQRTACEGVPKIKRHLKGSHANATPVTDGKHLVVWFATEGLYCYDFTGKLLWKRDLGVQDSGFFSDPEMQWGASSSPILFKNLVILQCDRQKDSFLAAYTVDSGKPAWRTPRDEPPSWGTPTLYEGKSGPELITNGTNYARGYDPKTGKELWRVGRHSEITVPTPIIGQGLIFVTNGYRPVQPIYAIWPGARGDLSLKSGQDSSEQIAWSKSRGGPYMPTPIVYGDYLYVCSNNGQVVCYHARTGKLIYRQRLGGSGTYTASPVAADGRVYFTSEEGQVRVVKAGPIFKLLAVNEVGDTCLATPAISDGMIFVRGQHHLFGIGRQAKEK
jgi:outer membrane protein assembly factor BamB